MGRLNSNFINTVLFGFELDELLTDIDEWEFAYLANYIGLPMEERNFYKHALEQVELARENKEGYDPSMLVTDSNNCFV